MCSAAASSSASISQPATAVRSGYSIRGSAAVAVQEINQQALEVPSAGRHKVRAIVHILLAPAAHGLPQRQTAQQRAS